ncbi:MAG: SDR family oxidoreductase [Alphaproteobacteria bacterium]|nr:SDR family oxidoreductase [Alphaproteobacteria bacterium]
MINKSPPGVPLWALITGASSGIGREFSLLCAEDGYNLVLVARDRAKLELVANNIQSIYSIQVHCFVIDLANDGAIQEIDSHLKQNNIEITVLINNAGLGQNEYFAEGDQIKVSEIILVNIKALTELTRLLLPGMIKNKSGQILNVASMAAFFPGPFMAVYFASKSYVFSFSRAIREELKGTGVTVTVFCPGLIATPFWEKANASQSRLVSSFLIAILSPKKATRIAYAALKKGKGVCVPGIQSKILYYLRGIVGVCIPLKIVRFLNAPKNKKCPAINKSCLTNLSSM